jgi:hypothetical protein
MATIGSINVAFTSELSGFQSGVDSVVSSLSGLSSKVDALAQKLSGLSSLSVSISVDSSRLEQASRSVESLRETAAGASATVTVAADTAQLASAGTAVESLGDSIGETSQAAVRARGSLASLVVSTGIVVTSVRQAVSAYADFRSSFLGFITSATGARNAGQAFVLTMRGLRGDVDSLRVIFGATRAGIEGFVSGILSAENVNRLLQGSLGGVLRLFGATDEAVVRSTQAIAGIITEQISHAASHRLVQRSLQLLGSAYDSSTESLARFLTGTSAGRAASAALSTGLQVSARAAVQANAAINATVSQVGRFLTSTQLVGRVAAATGTAFDAVASAASGLLSRASSLDTGMSGVLLRLSLVSQAAVSSIPSLAGMGTAASAVAASVARASASLVPFVGLAARASTVLQVLFAAGRESTSALDFTSVVASTAASTAAIGAFSGAVIAASEGCSVLSGAVGGAAGALSGLVSLFPITAALATAAAVATGRFAEELLHVGQNAQQMGDLADRFGQPVQEIEKLKIAAQSSGVAIQSVVRAQQTFSQNASKVKVGNLGSAQAREAKAAFDQLGISAETLRNSRPEQVFLEVAGEISRIPDATKRTQVAMDLFGRTGPALLPMLKSLEQINEDIGRLGGTISDLDFERFTDVNQSFDRLRTASGAMTDDLAIPFTRMQEAFNNAKAEIIGGLAPLVGAFAEVIADISTPFAVLIEVAGRVVGTLARIAAAAAKLATSFLPFATIAAIFETLGEAFEELWSYVEGLVDRFDEFASAVEESIRPTVEGFVELGESVTEVLNAITRFAGLGNVFGPVSASLIGAAAAFAILTTSTQVYTAVMSVAGVQSVVAAVRTAAAWVAAGVAIAASLVGVAVAAIGVYLASLITATAATIASAAAMHVAWLFALGPLGLLIGAVELAAVGIAALWAVGSGVAEFFSGWGEGTAKIDGATASVEQLAEAAAANQSTGEPGFLKDIEAVARAAGATEQQIEQMKTEAQAAMADMGFEIEEPVGFSAIVATIEEARGEFADLSIRAAKFGQAGADAASKSSEEFNELQRSLADGKISAEEFEAQSAELADSLSESLDAIASGSPEETLKRNLEVFKELDGAVKQAAKSARDLSAGVQIEDSFFPRSEEVKARAKQYADEYSQALDEIKQKLASGGFQQELDARRDQNQQDFDTGKISREEFVRIRAELDSTSAQEQASIAVEDVQRDLDRKNARLKVDLDFADEIRRKLEDAFLSPIQKMEKELTKVALNSELTPLQKEQASTQIKDDARKQLIGESAQAQLTERTQNLSQARNSGLISAETEAYELSKAMDDFASSVGATKTPFQEFASRSADIAKQFGMTGQPLEEVRKNLAGNAEQLAIFESAVKNARDALLQSLGVEKSPQQVFEEQMAKIDEAANATDPAKRITAQEAAQARDAALRKRDESLGVPADMRSQFAQRQAQINEAFAADPAKKAIAENALAIDRRKAAGLDATPAQQLAAGEAQIRASGLEGAELQEALKKNRDSVLQSVGIEKSAMQVREESIRKLQGLNLSAEEAAQANRAIADSFMSAIGVTKTPFEQFSGQIDSIADKFGLSGKSIDEVRDALKGNKEDLELFDRAVKEARDSLLQSLGIEKSPQQVFEEQMAKIEEAANSTDPNKKISAEQRKQAEQAALKKRDEALGAGGEAKNFASQMADRKKQIEEAYGVGGSADPEKYRLAMNEMNKAMPGADPEDPLSQFKDSMKQLEELRTSGVIDDKEFASRKMNLQADLQEGMKPALDNVAQDRRQIDSSDTRSKAGVDTFFRILRGNDNPSLKAQLEIARNTRLLAEAQQEPDAAPVIAQLSAK